MATNPKPDVGEAPLLWDISTVQRQLGGIHRGSVDRLVRQGKLERVKVGTRSMVTRRSVEALIEASRANTALTATIAAAE